MIANITTLVESNALLFGSMMLALGVLFFLVQVVLKRLSTKDSQSSSLEELQFLARIPDEIPHPVFRLDRKTGEVLYANRACDYLIYEWSDRDSLYLPEGLLKKISSDLADTNATEELIKVGDQIYNILFVKVEGETYVNAYGRDITRRLLAESNSQRARDQLGQAAKLAALGEMAASIAHELNNPLTAVKGYAQMLAMEANGDKRIEKMGLRIDRAASRMSKIVDHLRGFARKSQREDWTLFSLQTSINDALMIMETQLRARNITINLDLPSNAPQIHGDHSQIESVIQNLLSNSRDAYDKTKIKNPCISIKSSWNDENVTIIYTDNAGGMPPEVAARVCQPFFTTKLKGEGTGIGMSISHSIVKEHGGLLTIETEQGIGSTFTISIPLPGTQQKPAFSPLETNRTSPKEDSSLSTQPTILIVERDQDICETLEMALQSDFSITIQNERDDILRDLANQPYDVVLASAQIPDLSCAAITNMALQSNPNASVFVMSGHIRVTRDITDALEAGATDLIQKPFSSLVEVKRMLLNTVKRYAA